MKHDFSTVGRLPVLCNGAAEFIETRPEKALGSELASAVDGAMAQYDPETDRFKLMEDTIEIDCLYAESREKAKNLQSRLLEFNDRIHGRGVRLNIANKSPDAYDMDDVLNIVERIREKHSENEKAKSFSGTIRRFFRSTAKRTGTLETLLGFAPDDIYGAVITGGLTMILGAVERADKLRSDIYSAAADIPLLMVEVRGILLPYDSRRMDAAAELHKWADRVFFAIFDVLFAIVDEITKSLRGKTFSLLVRGKDHGKEIDESLGVLKNIVESFRNQANPCLHQRVGGISVTVESIEATAEHTDRLCAEIKEMGLDHHLVSVEQKAISLETHTSVVETQMSVRETHTSVKDIEKGLEQLKQMASGQSRGNVVNNFYVLYKGSPIYDPVAGGLDMERFQRRQEEELYRDNVRRARENGQRTGKWLENLAAAHLDTGADGRSIMEQFKASEQTEQDKVHYLLMSEKLSAWIGATGSTALIIKGTSESVDVFNAVSFVSAFIHHGLCSADRSACPVLGFFGGCRALEDTCGSTTRPDGMLAALLAQLLEQVKDRPDVDISVLGDPPRSLSHSSKERRIRVVARRLKKLIRALPSDCTVYVVLDSVWRMGEGKGQDEALRRVLDLVPWTEEEGGGAVVKILATDFIGDAPYAKHSQDGRFAFLDLPDTVDSSGMVIDPDNLDFIVNPGEA